VLKIPKNTKPLPKFVEEFYEKYDEAMKYLVENGIPSWVLDKQVVLLDIPRVAGMLYRGHFKTAPPALLLDGLIRHALWSALLERMYPGGEAAAIVTGEYKGIPAQGHPDYLHRGLGIVFEVKTVGWGSWKAVQKRANRKHTKQLRTYAKFAGLKKGYLIYQQRDSLDVVVIEVKI
jgi:hypothetical protein